jgi:hypothetical protein
MSSNRKRVDGSRTVDARAPAKPLKTLIDRESASL